MYADLKIVSKIGKSKAEMKQTIGVRQGDCMAPVLLFFTMMAFAERVEEGRFGNDNLSPEEKLTSGQRQP